MSKTVVAIATPPGEGAIGIIRMTGEEAIKIADYVFQTPGNTRLSTTKPKTMVYGHIYDKDSLVDEVMLVTYTAPKSYTKENMVEIFTHGGYVAISNVFDLLVRKGASPAEPGEFTKRAFLNGRIDLVQAESIMDMVSAKSKVGFKAAIDGLEGKFSREINEIAEQLTNLIAQIEVIIDYPDEDVEFITRKDMLNTCQLTCEHINGILATYSTGRIIRDGLQLAIVGKPNVGKSSLMNAFLRESRAIVTHFPGTTRDILSEMISIEGISVNIIDTAGIRDTSDYVESIGIERAKQVVQGADLVLYVMDLNEALTDDDIAIMEMIQHKKTLLILNKSDLEQRLDVSQVLEKLSETTAIRCSLLNQEDIQMIEHEIIDLVVKDRIFAKEGNILTNARHQSALLDSRDALNRAISDIKNEVPLDMIQFSLHEAYRHIGEITGVTIDADVVSTIFSKFCLGK